MRQHILADRWHSAVDIATCCMACRMHRMMRRRPPANDCSVIVEDMSLDVGASGRLALGRTRPPDLPSPADSRAGTTPDSSAPQPNPLMSVAGPGDPEFPARSHPVAYPGRLLIPHTGQPTKRTSAPRYRDTYPVVEFRPLATARRHSRRHPDNYFHQVADIRVCCNRSYPVATVAGRPE